MKRIIYRDVWKTRKSRVIKMIREQEGRGKTEGLKYLRGTAPSPLQRKHAEWLLAVGPAADGYVNEIDRMVSKKMLPKNYVRFTLRLDQMQPPYLLRRYSYTPHG